MRRPAGPRRSTTQGRDNRRSGASRRCAEASFGALLSVALALSLGDWRISRADYRTCNSCVARVQNGAMTEQPGREDLARWMGLRPTNYYEATPNLRSVLDIRAGATRTTAME